MSGGAANAERCIDLCNACALACNRCAAACVAEEMPGMARCIALDTDCAAACAMAAAVMARGSENVALVCGMCAELCKRCAAECGSHDMDHCQRCAEACRQCEAECRRMTA
jgi:hypothetical protein